MADDYDYTPRSAEGSSKDAGEYLSKSGKTAALKDRIRGALTWTEGNGLTVKEFMGSAVCPSDVHHGQVSGAFSRLHQQGYINRLQERRGHSEVYVLPSHVNGRPTREHGSAIRARRQEEAQAAKTAPVKEEWQFPAAAGSQDMDALRTKADAVASAMDMFPQIGMSAAGRQLESAIIDLVDEIQKS